MRRKYLLCAFLIGASAMAAAPLPYSVRTHPYTGISSAVRGDTRTVGTAGATIGVADTFLAATSNPAGLAMTLRIGDDNFTRSRVRDSFVQDFEQPVDTANAGLAANVYPWGFSAGYLLPYRESAVYDHPVLAGKPTLLEVSVHELRLAGARVLMDDRLSLGVSLNIGQAKSEIVVLDGSRPELGHHAYGLGVTLGAMYQLPRRFLLGASLSTPRTYAGSTADNIQASVPGFFQEVRTPWNGGLGVGWIPNRFFRGSLEAHWIGSTSGTALLRDDRAWVGQDLTLQPRMGAAYIFCDFKNLQGTLFAGTYYETSRLADAPARLHKTWGVEVKPWILTLGFGSDRAPNYKNAFASVNIDIFKTMEQLTLLPSSDVRRVGFIPNPFVMSDMDLPQPLMGRRRAGGPSIDPIQVGLELPKKIGEGEFIEKAIDAAKDLPDALGKEIDDMKRVQRRRLRETPERR